MQSLPKILKKESVRSKSTLCHSKTYQRGFILTERRVAEKAKHTNFVLCKLVNIYRDVEACQASRMELFVKRDEIFQKAPSQLFDRVLSMPLLCTESQQNNC